MNLAILYAIFIIVGVLGIAFRNKIAMSIAKLNPLLPPKYTLIGLVAVGVLLGGIGGFGLIWSSVTGSVASVTEGISPSEAEDITGDITVELSDGYFNSTFTTIDYIDDDKDFMTFYVPDADCDDGDEFGFNVTITRSNIAEDANIKVTCTAPDKELSDVTAKNLIEKTSGQIDLDYVGASGTGTHATENSVWVWVPMAEGTASDEIMVKADQEESYIDGMTDMDDYFDIFCDAGGTPFQVRVYANS